MPNVEPVAYEQAGDQLRKLYDEICEARGLLEPPNWALYLGSTPHVLEGMWQMLRITEDDLLSPLLSQLLLFAVSRASAAEYCAEYHGALVMQLDNQLSYDDLLAICKGDSRGVIPQAYQVAIDVAVEQVGRHCVLPLEEKDRLLEEGFSAHECLEIFSTIACAEMISAYTMSADVPIDEKFHIPGFQI